MPATPTTSPERAQPVHDVSARHRAFGLRTALIAGCTLVSRVLGYGREILSAWLFGDRSGIFDAFITAWRVPNLFRRFLGEGALSTSLQTGLTHMDAHAGDEAGRGLFLATVRVLVATLAVLCGVVMLLVWQTPDRMPWTGLAWLGADPAALRELTIRVMPFVILACLAAAAGGALNVRGHFAMPALGPALLNVVWIGTLAAIAVAYGSVKDLTDTARQLEMVRWLAWGVLVAGCLQLAVLLPALVKRGLWKPGELWRTPAPADRAAAWGVVKSAAPLALGAAVYQINVMVDGFMAEALLPDGAPTLHYYANRVQQFPMALISVAATSAVFPALAALGQTGRNAELGALHARTQRAILFLALPASFCLFALAEPIVRVSFERGAFGEEGVLRTAAALRVLALAVVPAGAVGLVARSYYAVGDFRTPVRVSCVLLVVNAGLNLLFLLGFGMDIDGLALATTLTSTAHLVWLGPRLRPKLGLEPRGGGVLRAAVRPALCALVGAGFAAGTYAGLSGSIGRGAALGTVLVATPALYFALAAACGVPELGDVLRRLGARFGRR